jgi:WD40 repeat protein
MHQPQHQLGHVLVWDLKSGRRADPIETSFNGVFSLALSHDGRHLAVGGGGIVIGSGWEYTNGIEVWDLDNLHRIARFGNDLFFVESMAFSRDDSVLLSTNHPRPGAAPREITPCVRLWRTDRFELIRAFAESRRPVRHACFSSDERYIVFCYPSGPDITVEVPRREVPFLTESDLQGRFADARKDFEKQVDRGEVQLEALIKVWDSISKRETKALPITRGRVTQACFSPDGSLIASSGTSLIIWDFAQRREIAQLELPGGEIGFTHCVAFSADGRFVAAGTGSQRGFGQPYENCAIKIWDVARHQLVRILPHDTPVARLQFSTDGSRIIGGGQSELLVWELPADLQSR